VTTETLERLRWSAKALGMLHLESACLETLIKNAKERIRGHVILARRLPVVFGFIGDDAAVDECEAERQSTSVLNEAKTKLASHLSRAVLGLSGNHQNIFALRGELNNRFGVPALATLALPEGRSERVD
jgi:hypothetical protein